MTAHSSRLRRALIAACILFLCAYYLFTPTLSENRLHNELLDTVLTRGLCSLVFLLTLIDLESPALRPFCAKKEGVSRKIPLKSLLYCLPWLAIAVNNLAILPLLDGTARVTATLPEWILFTLGCFFIGMFEETAFRGVIFLAALRRFGSSPKQIFLAIATTSAIFGLFHLLNLAAGASPIAVLMQVGYSFLIGGMCAIALLKTGSIWVPIFLHALYDFNGYLVPTLGEGTIWTSASIALTAVVAVSVAIYTVVVMLRITPQEVDRCM